MDRIAELLPMVIDDLKGHYCKAVNYKNVIWYFYHIIGCYLYQDEMDFIKSALRGNGYIK